jgi:hypothetical protein
VWCENRRACGDLASNNKLHHPVLPHWPAGEPGNGLHVCRWQASGQLTVLHTEPVLNPALMK